MHKSKKGFLAVLLMIALLTTLLPLQVGYAASLPDVVNALSAEKAVSTTDTGSSGGGLGKLLEFLFDKILGPILNLGKGSGGGVRSGNLSGKTIVLDPGHGGGNPGAVGPGGVNESNINLAVGLKLKKLLENSGAKVVMTRTTDRYVAAPGSSLGQELQARLDIADANNADVFISLHSNSNEDASIQGAMTFYHASGAKPLADSIQQSLIKTTGAVNKGVQPGTFYVIRNASMPSVLVEMGFVSNPTEEQKMDSSAYQDKLAQGIYQGIVAHFAK